MNMDKIDTEKNKEKSGTDVCAAERTLIAFFKKL